MTPLAPPYALSECPLRQHVKKQGKASRGKHRWIGFQVENPQTSRNSIKKTLGDLLDDTQWRLFDVVRSENQSICVIRVNLTDSDKVVSTLNDSPSISTLTKSGKIRLVRKRLGLERPARSR